MSVDQWVFCKKCGWKLAKLKSAGRYEIRARRNAKWLMWVEVVVGSTRCPRCEEWYDIPPVNLKPMTEKEAEHVGIRKPRRSGSTTGTGEHAGDAADG